MLVWIMPQVQDWCVDLLTYSYVLCDVLYTRCSLRDCLNVGNVVTSQDLMSH